MSKTLRFLHITAEHQYCPFSPNFKHKNFIPKYLDNALTDFAYTSDHRAGYWRKSSCERFWKNSPQCQEILQQVK